MAFYDWDGDGKKDFFDDVVEYHVYKEATKDFDSEPEKNYNYKPSSGRSGGGVSNFGAFVGTILSIFISAAIISPFGLEGIPLVILFIIVCSIVAAVIACWFDSIGF